MDLGGIAAIITALAVMISSIGALWITSRKLRPIHGMVTQIDAAVNGKPPGATTMVSQVQDLHDETFPKVDPFENGGAILPLLRRLALDVEEIKATQRGERT